MTDKASPGTYVLVTTTCSDRAALQQIAQHLVESRLAACVQFTGPVLSVYRWEEKLESTEEWVLQVKTRASLWETVVATINSLHPYDVPELLATPLAKVAPDYQQWLDENLLS